MDRGGTFLPIKGIGGGTLWVVGGAKGLGVKSSLSEPSAFTTVTAGAVAGEAEGAAVGSTGGGGGVGFGDGEADLLAAGAAVGGGGGGALFRRVVAELTELALAALATELDLCRFC